MKKFFMISSVPFLLFASCQKQQLSDLTASDKQASSPVTHLTGTNKWGAIINKSTASEDSVANWTTAQTRLATPAKRVAAAVALGVSYYRMSLDAKDWLDASGGISYQNSKMQEYTIANQNNLAVLLNVLWQPVDDVSVNFAAGDYSTTGSEMYQFGACVKGVLRKCDSVGYKPAFIVVENEEDNTNYYNINVAGQPQQYIKELTLAKAICDTVKFSGVLSAVRCTNGGITARSGIYTTYYYNTVTSPSNTVTFWQNWANSVLPPNCYYGLINQNPPAGSGITKAGSALIQSQISTVDTLLDAYKNTIHLSYMNMHWYEPIRARFWDMSKNGNVYPFSAVPYGGVREDTVGINGMTFVKNCFAAKVSGSSVMSNETGQLRFNTCLTKSLMNTANANLSYVVLYDGDGEDYSFGAKAYHNTTSLTSFTLRGIGNTAKDYITGVSTTPCAP